MAKKKTNITFWRCISSHFRLGFSANDRIQTYPDLYLFYTNNPYYYQSPLGHLAPTPIDLPEVSFMSPYVSESRTFV